MDMDSGHRLSQCPCPWVLVYVHVHGRIHVHAHSYSSSVPGPCPCHQIEHSTGEIIPTVSIPEINLNLRMYSNIKIFLPGGFNIKALLSRIFDVQPARDNLAARPEITA
jgi:hypothetical protein